MFLIRWEEGRSSNGREFRTLERRPEPIVHASYIHSTDKSLVFLPLTIHPLFNPKYFKGGVATRRADMDRMKGGQQQLIAGYDRVIS